MGNKAAEDSRTSADAAGETPVDLDFRPGDYWGADALALQVLARISGTERRERAEQALEAEGLDGLERLLARDPNLLDATLDEPEREFRAHIHPSLMGGEYLPKLKADEVEIARIELRASALNDVIRVTARHGKRGILYAVRDEYPELGAYRQPFRMRKHPLTLRELAELIDGSMRDGDEGDGILLGFFQQCLDSCDPEGGEVESIVRARSVYYPQLGEHYRREMRRVLEEMKEDYGEDLDEDEDPGF